MTTLAELDAYVEQLNKHDWTYEYSDDHRVYQKGLAKQRELEANASGNQLLSSAYVAYLTWYSSGAGALEKIFRDAVIGGLRKDLKLAATVELIAPGNEVA